MKKQIHHKGKSPEGKTPAAVKGVTKPSPKPDIGLDVERDCICELMAPHCPIHAVRAQPQPGSDVIR